MEDRLSWDELYPLMDEVKAMARSLLRRERQRLADQDWSMVTWADRQYFFRALYRAWNGR